MRSIVQGQYVLPQGLSESCKDLIRQMLDLNRQQRISIEGIKQHPWFTQAMPEALEVRSLLRLLLTA